MSELRWAGPTLVQVKIDKTAVLSIRDTNSLPSKSKWQVNFLNGLKLRFISFALAVSMLRPSFNKLLAERISLNQGFRQFSLRESGMKKKDEKIKDESGIQGVICADEYAF